MSKDWEIIAQCLRAELADYGGLLNLFEQQQRRLSARDSETVLSFATRIEAQARLIAQSRTRREQAVAAFAGDKGRPTTSSLRTMLSLIEPDARPLLKALITEVGLLLHRVRRASRHNHTMLTRAVEVHNETLQHLRPPASKKTTSSASRLVAIGAH
jgi:flagellar biosynthesis/type III secretory pathway chaperone